MLRWFAFLTLSLCVAAVASSGAEAAIKKMRFRNVSITDSPENSPNPLFVGHECCPEPPFDTIFLDDATPDQPVLHRLVFKTRLTTTVDLTGNFGPGSAIFLAQDTLEGPGPIRKPSLFTGTGNTQAGETIAWGTVTGWTVTGALYCNSSPPVVCAIASSADDTTTEPFFTSDFFDLGTWIFHGTGFTATPWVWNYFSINFGNNQRWLRGHYLVDATVPALPALGLALIGGSLVAGALASLHRRRER